MGTKKITQLSSSLTPPLSGVTVIVHDSITYKTPLSTLRQVLVDSGSHAYSGSQTINGNLNVTGSLNIYGDIQTTGTTTLKKVMIGSGSFDDLPNQEIIHVQNSGSNLIGKFIGNSQFYTQLHVQNINDGNSASSDIVISSDNGTDFLHFIDLGINSSNYQAGFVGEENDAYLINVGKDLYIGTIGNPPTHYSKLKLFGMGNWRNPEMTIDNTTGKHLISFNTGSVTSGYTYEFSGSMKINHDVKINGAVTIENILTLTPLDTLPSNPPIGSIASSGSVGQCKPYFWDGSSWTSLI